MWWAREAGLSRHVESRASLLQCAAQDDVVDGVRLDAGAFQRSLDGMCRQGLSLGGVEGAAIGLADGRTGDGNDDRITHE
jgi:hypothetical protein